MKNLFVESGKGTQENVTIFVIFDFLNWVLHIQGLIILLFILLCIFKILHNLKVYTVEDLKKGSRSLNPKYLISLKDGNLPLLRSVSP